MLADTTNFLSPTATIIPEAVVFFILLGLMAKYVVPPLSRAMETRRTQIAESLAVIEEAKSIQEQADARAQRVMDEARQQARATVEQATRQAEEAREELLQRGRQEYERILARAQGEIERERQRASDELRAYLAELVVITSQRVIERQLDPQVHRDLVDAAIAEVEAHA